MIPPLKQIPVGSGELSIGADIFRQYKRGEISEKDYYIFNAALVAHTAHEERQRVYIPIPSGLRSYVQGRLGGCKYDQSLSKQLGEWRYEIYQAFDHNRYILSLFEWAKEKCQAVSLSSESQALEKAIDRFESIPFPSIDYLRTCEVQKIDSNLRTKERV